MATPYTIDADFTMAINLVKRGILKTLEEGRVAPFLRELGFVCTRLMATHRANILVGPINDPQNRPMWIFLRHCAHALRDNRLNTPDFIEKARIIFPSPSGYTSKNIDKTVGIKRKETLELDTGRDVVEDDQATKKMKISDIRPAARRLDVQSAIQLSSKDRNHKNAMSGSTATSLTSEGMIVNTTPEPAMGDLGSEEDTHSDIYYYAPGERGNVMPIASDAIASTRIEQPQMPTKNSDGIKKPRKPRRKPIPTRYVFTTGCVACVNRKRNHVCRVAYRGKSCYQCAKRRRKCVGVDSQQTAMEVKNVELNERIDPKDVVEEVFVPGGQRKLLGLPQSSKQATLGNQNAETRGMNNDTRMIEPVPQRQVEREPIPAGIQDRELEQRNRNLNGNLAILANGHGQAQALTFGTRVGCVQDKVDSMRFMADRMMVIKNDMRIMADRMQVIADDIQFMTGRMTY